MSALSGSLSYQRFFVERDLPRDFVAKAHGKIVAQAMRPLSPNEPESERSGWCVLGEPLDVELERSRVFLDGFVNLGLRTDCWAIPSAVFKTRLREVESQERTRKGRDWLGRNEKAEIKELVTRELRKKVLPVVRSVDLSWSLEERVVRFFSHSKKSTGAMLVLFEKTFGIDLVAESPYTQGRRLGLSDAQMRAWDTIVPLARDGRWRMTDLAVLVDKRRFVGRELLLWLWMESELFEATLETSTHGSFGLWIEKKLVLSHEDESTRITAPMPGAGREAKEALRRGQLPEAAALRIAWKDDETSLAIDAETFAVRGLRLRTVLEEKGSGLAGDLVDEMAGKKRGKPKRKKDTRDEAELAEEAAFQERMIMTREIEDLLATLYRDFLALRLSPAWNTVVTPTMRAWAAGDDVDADAYRRAKRGKPKKR